MARAVDKASFADLLFVASNAVSAPAAEDELHYWLIERLIAKFKKAPSITVLRQYMNEKSRPSAKLVGQLAEVLDADAGWKSRVLALPKIDVPILSPDFAERLDKAIEDHPRAQKGHGKQRWLAREIGEKFGKQPSFETARRWFAGEVKPRREVLKQIAEVLGVDEAWLSYGTNPDTITLKDKNKRNARASGVVNLVAGNLSLAGVGIAFPKAGASEPDLYAVVEGEISSLSVCHLEAGSSLVSIHKGAAERTIIVTPTQAPTVFRFLTLTAAEAEELGDVKGGFINLPITIEEGRYVIGGRALNEITNFTDLQGVAQRIAAIVKSRPSQP